MRAAHLSDGLAISGDGQLHQLSYGQLAAAARHHDTDVVETDRHLHRRQLNRRHRCSAPPQSSHVQKQPEYS